MGRGYAQGSGRGYDAHHSVCACADHCLGRHGRADEFFGSSRGDGARQTALQSPGKIKGLWWEGLNADFWDRLGGQVILNPKLRLVGNLTARFFEGCLR